MKLLKRGHSVVVGASSTDETRFILNSVLIEDIEKGLRTVGTDGRMMAIVEDIETDLTGEDFPPGIIPADAPNGSKGAIVPAEAFNAVFKSLPKKRNALPVLQTVAVVMGANETTFGTTDLQSGVAKRVRNIDGNFPNYRQVIPTKAPTLTIGFNPALLGRALKMAETFGLSQVNLEFTDDKSPVKITGDYHGQRLTLVVMPMRI